MIGRTLDHYRIESKLGEGGMGVVYKARDTRLERAVAIKVLPADKVADPARKQRFAEEAKAASALNHPNIVTIHDIRTWEGVDFIVMEFIDGKTIEEMIPAGGMRATQALRFAVQIADALAKAHSAGILHRDLKPSNIMATDEGRIKVLDFGLAKLLERQTSSEAPTATMRDLTEEGAVVGTAAYMSPEQAEGRKVDARSDVFSFGAVLYKMMTGQRAFSGDSGLATLHRIVSEDPTPPGQIAAVAPEAEKLILRCLRKDPARRFQTMADLKVALEDLETETSASQTRPAPAAVVRPKTRRRSALVAAALVAAAGVGWLAWRALGRSPAASALRTVKFTFRPAQLARGSATDIDAEVSISPDGKHVTYVESDGGQLWMRDLDQEQAHVVPGATHVYQVFWSPDSQFIGYAPRSAQGARSLVKIPIQGGTPVEICKSSGDFRRAAWSSDGETIVYCDTTGMYTVPAKGGTPTPVLEHQHIEHPSFLDQPGGRRAFLFQAVDAPPKHGIYVQAPGEKRRLITLSSSSNPYPVYTSGHIVYVDGTGDATAIWALPFSLATLTATGKPFPIAQRGSSPQASRNGTLVYSDLPSDRMQLVWVDRSGKRLATVGEPQRQDIQGLSPDGRKLAVEVREGDPDLWIYDVERGIKTRLTFDAASEGGCAWTPEGDEIAYASNRSGNFDIYSQPANGTGEAKALVTTPAMELEPEWSPGRKYLMYETASKETRRDLMYRERRSDGTLGEAKVFLRTPADEANARFSPDGRMVAYSSNESGDYQVYVRSFPDGKGKWQVSAERGIAPRWRRDGKELFYVAGSRLMAAPVSAGPEFSPKPPVVLFEQASLRVAYPEYDVTPDGQRFIVREKPAGDPPLAIHVVYNWLEEFRGRQ